MTIVPPFHTSNEEDPPVWHDNNQCIEGKKIEKKNWLPGKNGKKCDICEGLDNPSPKSLWG